MAYEKNKGMIAVATSYGGGDYHFEKLDQYIEASSYNVTPDQMQDIDSFVNANGKLKRTTMPYSRSKIEFNIVHTDEKTMDKVMSVLNKGTEVKDGIAAENKVRIRFYNPKRMEYSFAWAYFPDITYNTYSTHVNSWRAVYAPTRIAFITYGEKVKK